MKRGLLLLALVLLAGATSYAQQPSFRADINFVEVHAVVTDERGRFIPDLTADDFEIREDGRRQKPIVFELIDLPAPEVSTALPATRAIEPDVRASVPTFEGRLYVFVLDDLHTTTLRSSQVRLAARKFVDEHLQPDDLAAVVFTSGRQDAAQELTGSRRLLRAAVDRFQGQKLPSATLERLAVHLRERDMEAAATGDGDSSSRGTPASQRVDDPLDGERGFNARRALEMVRDVARWLSAIDGRRKALVLFSEGIDYDIHDVFNNRSASNIIHDAREAIAAAQRANVSIYAVDPRGLSQLGDQAIEVGSLSPDANVTYGSSRDFNRELLLAQESLIWLAEDTGGIALVRSNDIAGGLRRIAEDNSRYYVWLQLRPHQGCWQVPLHRRACQSPWPQQSTCATGVCARREGGGTSWPGRQGGDVASTRRGARQPAADGTIAGARVCRAVQRGRQGRLGTARHRSGRPHARVRRARGSFSQQD